MEQSETILIQQLKAGNDAAYRTLYQLHYGLLCAYAQQIVGNDFDAENIVDDTIFHIWEIRDQLQIDRSLRSFLITSVHRRCLNWIRQHSRQPATCAIPKDELLNIETSAHPLGHLLEKELEEKIRAAIEALPHETRQVFELSRYNDMTYDEIAKHLGISVNTVKYHIKNALHLLYNQLEPYLLLLLLIG
jgi:RNA polymerase sigma-70 factor (ECF subfamily)